MALAGTASLVALDTAQAADWPQRPVTVVVPQAADNNPDVLCRIITDNLSLALGQQFIVENSARAANVVAIYSSILKNHDAFLSLADDVPTQRNRP